MMTKRRLKKYKNIAIEKLCPPIPIFSQIETIPQGLVIN